MIRSNIFLLNNAKSISPLIQYWITAWSNPFCLRFFSSNHIWVTFDWKIKSFLSSELVHEIVLEWNSITWSNHFWIKLNLTVKNFEWKRFIKAHLSEIRFIRVFLNEIWVHAIILEEVTSRNKARKIPL